MGGVNIKISELYVGILLGACLSQAVSSDYICSFHGA